MLEIKEHESKYFESSQTENDDTVGYEIHVEKAYRLF
jgi:hypothetical protein